MVNLSDGLMLALSQAFAARFAGGSIRLFTGEPPSAPSAAEIGTMLGIVSINADGTGLQFSAATAYVYNPPADRWAFKALESGTAGYFRLVAPGDMGLVSANALRIDGTIGAPFSGADMEWETPAVTKDATYQLDSFVYIVHPIPRT